METPCPICESPLRTEIEEKDAAWKPMQTVQWARKKGLSISRFALVKHRVNHLNQSHKGDDASKIGKPIDPLSDNNAAPGPERNLLRKAKETKIRSNPAPNIDAVGAADLPGNPQSPVDDQLFLDTVRDMVYRKLLSGEMELKLDSAFKAIEIKHKIMEETQNEKLLLEILEEIRAEELARKKQDAISQPA
jgi:hypothetical protein